MSQEAINLIYNELASRGVKPNVAAGAIAGIMGESGPNIDPTSFNSKDPNGGAGGILQWNADRLVGPTGLLAFARASGVPVDINTPTDSQKVPLAIQVKFMGHELDGRYNSVLKGLQSLNNGEEGLTTWVNNMEVPADKTGAIAQRAQYIEPVSRALGAPATPTASAAVQPAAAKPPLSALYPPLQTPLQQVGSSVGQALAGMGSVTPTPEPPEPPAVRSMAAMSDFTAPAASPVPAQFAQGVGGGLGAQLGALAGQTPPSQLVNPQTAPSTAPGAPSLSAALGALGSQAVPVNDPRQSPYSRLPRLT